MLTHLSLLVLALQALAAPSPRNAHDDAVLGSGSGSVAQVPLGVADNGADRHAPERHPEFIPPPSTSTSASTSSTKERYDGHEVWRVHWKPIPDFIRDEIMGILDALDLDIWRADSKSLDVRVPPSLSSALSTKLGRYPGVRLAPFVSDVQALVEGAYVSEAPEGGWNVTSLDSPFHDGYHVLEDVYSFGDALVEAFADKVSSFEVGQTAEGRAIRAWTAKINKAEQPEPGPGPGAGAWGARKRDEYEPLEIIVQAGAHAREWVSTSAAFYFLHKLVLDATDDPHSIAAKILEVFTVTVVPVINPDGFTYSHEHSRLWKKNRQNVGGLLCKGIDLNGNWGYMFQPSRLACSDSYKGSRAFEAHETRAMSDYLVNGTATEGESRAKTVKAFIDLHSYGQLFMFPFAYSCADFPPDAENLMEAGLGVAKAMRTTAGGEGYQTGQACDLTYRSTGDAIDYSYGTADVRWSYSAELRDTGTYGFVLPPHLIRPTGAEVSAGIRYLAQFIYETEIED